MCAEVVWHLVPQEHGHTKRCTGSRCAESRSNCALTASFSARSFANSAGKRESVPSSRTGNSHTSAKHIASARISFNLNIFQASSPRRVPPPPLPQKREANTFQLVVVSHSQFPNSQKFLDFKHPPALRRREALKRPQSKPSPSKPAANSQGNSHGFESD
eukprot:TRINITY_DN680_c0_g1_i1.p1 TRINITY_DN680_c0_g1~~TRINITY_DN680_c0_g1_i1.p1  ORF type:complete len:160 (-),score=9.03 TRINITY_DN680_c0_g1_i1:81-560(-)